VRELDSNEIKQQKTGMGREIFRSGPNWDSPFTWVQVSTLIGSKSSGGDAQQVNQVRCGPVGPPPDALTRAAYFRRYVFQLGL
jgi:hypothetical protein